MFLLYIALILVIVYGVTKLVKGSSPTNQLVTPLPTDTSLPDDDDKVELSLKIKQFKENLELLNETQEVLYYHLKTVKGNKKTLSKLPARKRLPHVLGHLKRLQELQEQWDDLYQKYQHLIPFPMHYEDETEREAIRVLRGEIEEQKEAMIQLQNERLKCTKALKKLAPASSKKKTKLVIKTKPSQLDQQAAKLWQTYDPAYDQAFWEAYQELKNEASKK